MLNGGRRSTRLSHGVRRYALRGWRSSVKKYRIGSISLAGDVINGERQRRGGVVLDCHCYLFIRDALMRSRGLLHSSVYTLGYVTVTSTWSARYQIGNMLEENGIVLLKRSRLSAI